MRCTTKTLSLFALLLSWMSVAALGCVEDQQGDWLTSRGQAIFYGTRDPTVVTLSQGEKLAIGYLTDSDGYPWCSGTLIDRDVVVTAQH